MNNLPQITVHLKFMRCVVSKQHCNQFLLRKSSRAKKVLELIHFDICGPINPYSNGKDILPLSLKILVEKHGCTFYKKNMKFL